jgi:hypothetical protein
MKYFFGFLVSIGLIILVVILVIKGFSGGGSKEQPMPLSDYAGTSSVMQLTVSGPIVGDQQFQSYRVSVGREQATIETRLGYEGTVVDQRIYANNQESYTNFLRALDAAGFTKGDKQSVNKDERGMCAIGDRYVMQIKSGSSDIQRFWSATCRGQGNFKGNAEVVRKLFNSQIPQADFSKLTNSLKL